MDGEPTNLELLDPPSPESLLPVFSWWPWVLAAAGVVLLGIGVYVCWRRRKPAGGVPDRRREVALAEAQAGLAAVVTGDVREAAVLCSLLLRRYLSVVADDPAFYETHEEFVARRDSLRALTDEARAQAAAGFSRLAALKYAPEPPAAEAAVVVAEARGLLATLHQGFVA